jgi:hypothetical protein
MCSPMAAVGFGLQAIGSVAGYGQQAADVKQANAEARQNAVNASVAASHQYEDEGRKLSYDTKALQQEGYNQAMEARRATGTAIASAGSSGLDVGSISVHSILSDIDQQEAINESNTQSKMDDKQEAYKANTISEKAQAQGRINSMPLKRKPSPLGAILGIATAGVDAITGSAAGKKTLGIT